MVVVVVVVADDAVVVVGMSSTLSRLGASIGVEVVMDRVQSVDDSGRWRCGSTE